LLDRLWYFTWGWIVSRRHPQTTLKVFNSKKHLSELRMNHGRIEFQNW